MCAACTTCLTACGGGDNDQSTNGSSIKFGSVAINQMTRNTGFSTNYTDQDSANSAARSACGIGCTTAVEFSGPGSCAAVAKSSNLAIGFATNNEKLQAQSNALQQCMSGGGTDCSIILEGCNQ